MKTDYKADDVNAVLNIEAQWLFYCAVRVLFETLNHTKTGVRVKG